MKRVYSLMPLWAGLLGLLGMGAYGVLLEGMDDSRLLPPGHPAGVLLFILCLLFLALLFIRAIWGPDRFFRVNTPLPLSALGCLFAAGAYFFQLSTPDAMPYQLLKAGAGVSFLVTAWGEYTGKRPMPLFRAIACGCTMILVFAQYQLWSKSTQLALYLFPALSSILIPLYLLMTLKQELDMPAPKWTAVLHSGALFCCILCLPLDPWFYGGVSLWLLGSSFYTPCKMALPDNALLCIRLLEEKGFEAYAVGGCVRDTLLGLTPHDFDLCTNATPQETAEIFSRYQLIRNGEKHGTVGVVLDKQVYEITTFRTEGGYQDNRHPDEVTFVRKLSEDLKRRDFTVNAIAYHPQKGYIDPYGGMQDLSDRVLRAVGDPESRFREDALRILRGVRFAVRFRLRPEQETLQAMVSCAGLMGNLSRERVFAELNALLPLLQDGDMTLYAPVLTAAVPQLKPLVGFQQHNPHHAYDVYTHTEKVLTALPQEPALRWAGLLHDSGKPACFTRDEQGGGHFYGHEKESARIAQEVLTALKAPTALKNQVVFLVENHMRTLMTEEKALRRRLSHHGEESLLQLLTLQRADDWNKGTKGRPLKFYDQVEKAIKKLVQEEGRLQVKDLALTGSDLLSLGFAPGPLLGQCQRAMLQKVLDGELPNEKQALTEFAKQYQEDA